MNDRLPEFLSPPEVARLLRVDASAVRTWIVSGELVASNLASRTATRPRWRISREALEAFLVGRAAVPRPPVKRRRRRDQRVIAFF